MAGVSSFRFDGRDLEELEADLRGAARIFSAEVDKTLLEVGAELKEAAEKLASAHSEKVAGSIKLRALPGKVIITAGSDDLPIAALWELGNKGTHDTAKVTGVWFRHPVFGSDTWVNQRRYPFLRPALDADRRHITKQMEAAWDHALEPFKLAPE